MTELEQYEIKLIKNYLAGEHLYPSRFEKNVQGNIESNYEYSYRENINNDTHNLTKQRVNINSQIRLFAEQMSHYDRQFSRSMYFDADSNEIRITPFKTSVVPYILPPDECVYDIEFSRESNNSQKEYKLLLLHQLIKIYNSIAVNNQIEKKIFECYQLIAKIDDLVLDNKAKAQYNEFKKEAEKQQEELKAERVRSVEILSIFAAVAMFSAGSISIVANQNSILYATMLIATFGVVLQFFVAAIHYVIFPQTSKKFSNYIIYLSITGVVLLGTLLLIYFCNKDIGNTQSLKSNTTVSQITATTK